MRAMKVILDAKREGRELSGDEIREIVEGYTKGDIPDYQMAAFAMAVCCRGMTDRETLALTESMRDSGKKLDWHDIPRPTADKHSTGGVGDKLSLVIQPIAASCGLAVPSLTGRGLGHTGGTADKLESIPGYNASLSLGDFKGVVAECGCSLTVSTEEIAPADRKLYALRDVTGTVPAIPLIVASILSKKLAEGAETLVFDVKCGRGAFMKTAAEAKVLASALVAGAKGAGRKSGAFITTMDEPLGYTIGNALEVQESIDVLKGAEGASEEIRELSLQFAAKMVSMAKGFAFEDSMARCRANLENGRAYEVFAKMCELQGGDLAAFGRRDRGECIELKVERSGFVRDIDAMTVALAALELGAGRKKAGDPIDMTAGIELKVKHGDQVKPGQVIAKLYSRMAADRLEMEAAHLASAFAFSDDKPEPLARIVGEI